MRARAVDVRGDAALQPRRRLPGRRLRAVRGGGRAVGTDPAWLIQPYIAFAAALLALALWALAAPLVARRALRGLAAFLGAQPALLFGYYLWGGVKEVVAARARRRVRRDRDRRAAGGPGRATVARALLTAAALAGVLSAGGLVWLVPAVAVVAIARFAGSARSGAGARRCAWPAVLAVPPAADDRLRGAAAADVLAAHRRRRARQPRRAARARAGRRDLARRRLPLPPRRRARRVRADRRRVSRRDRRPRVVRAARRAVAARLRARGPRELCRARRGRLALGGRQGARDRLAGDPVRGPARVGWLAGTGRRLAAAAVATAVAGGVLWSNALGYGGVSLAPRDQLLELERIGDRIEGQGPTLMTEYEPYGARHFLRAADAEGISELRRHAIPLRDGTEVPKGGSTDTDRVDPARARLLSDPGRAPVAGPEPPAVAVPAGLEGHLLRGLAAARGAGAAPEAATARRSR